MTKLNIIFVIFRPPGRYQRRGHLMIGRRMVRSSSPTTAPDIGKV